LLVVGITVSALTIDLGAAFIPSQVDHVKAATADPQSVNTDEDTPVDITLTGSDILVCELTFSITGDPSNGTLGSITDQGCTPGVPNTDSAIITYTPDQNANGSDTFEFQVTDGTTPSTATVTINIAAVNDVPVASDQSVTATEDTPKGITLTASDVDGDGLTFSIVTNPSHGNLTGTPPSVTYNPDANYNGSDSFTFKANDGTVDSNVATVSIDISAVNDPPVANAQSVSATEDTAKSITLTASDVDGDDLTFGTVGNPSHGNLNGTAPNVTYDPDSDYSGPDSFTFKANDGSVDSSTATVSITVSPDNDPPVANGQSVTVVEDTPEDITLTASDTDGDGLSYSIVDEPVHGTLSGTAPNVTYGPDLNYNGPDSFTFKANDGAGDSNTATVSITVSPANDAPVASGQSVTATEDTAKAITLIATDIDGGDLDYSIVDGPTHGNLTGTAPNVTYNPNLNYNGPDSFTFKADDGSSESNTATVSITVDPVNDVPTADDKTPSVNENSVVVITLSGSDVETCELVFQTVAEPSNGSLGTITNADCTAGSPNTDTATVTYTPLDNYNGSDSFTYTVYDGIVPSDIATVSITINPVNDPPTISSFAKTGPEEANIQFTEEDFAINFEDVDGDPLVNVKIISLPSNGTLKLNTAPVTLDQVILAADLDKLLFAPDLNFAGSTSFNWNASDGQAYAAANASVSITIDNENDPPTISNIANQTTNEDTLKGPISFTIGDPETPAGTLTLGKASSNTTLVPISNIVFGGSGANRTVTITPTLNLSGSATITISVSDGALTTSDSFVLTVNPVNDPPTFTKGSSQVVDEDAGAISVPGWATGITPGPPNESSQTLTFVTTNNNNALFSVQPAVGLNGTLSFTTAPNVNGSGTVTVTLKDNGGTANGGIDTSASQSFSITVTPTNDPPLAQDDIYSVMAGETLSKPAVEGVLANDFDIDGDALTAQKLSDPDSGDAILQPDGSFTYTPEIGFTGVVTFTYQASDGIETDVANVEIEVFDGSEPRVEFTAPVESGDTLDVYNQIVCLKAFAEDDIRIDRVRFYWWNPVALQYFDLSIDDEPPFEACIDTTSFPQGFNQVFAKSYDDSGNESARKWIWLYKVADLWRSLLPFVNR
jgi:hypothetical protein